MPYRVVWLSFCPCRLPHQQWGGKPGKSQLKQPSGGSSTKRDFHCCATPGCKFNFLGQDPHGHFQQSRAPHYFCAFSTWSLPLPVCTVTKVITRPALQLGSVELARRWLAIWNLAFLEHRASCRPLSISALTFRYRYFALSVDSSGPQPQVTGSPRAASLQSPGSVLPTFKEATTESTRQQTSSSPVSEHVCWLSATSLSRFNRILRRLRSLPRLYRRLRPFLCRGGKLVRPCTITGICLSLYPLMFPNCWQFPNIPRKWRRHTSL